MFVGSRLVSKFFVSMKQVALSPERFLEQFCKHFYNKVFSVRILYIFLKICAFSFSPAFFFLYWLWKTSVLGVEGTAMRRTTQESNIIIYIENQLKFWHETMLLQIVEKCSKILSFGRKKYFLVRKVFSSDFVRIFRLKHFQ